MIDTKPVSKLGLQEFCFRGTDCSLTDVDLWNLSAMADWVRAGNNVDFKMQNGNVVKLTSANIEAFNSAFMRAKTNTPNYGV